MYIAQRKGIHTAFLCVKTDRDALNHSNIIYGTSLLKIGQCYMTVFLIHPYRSDRCRYFLYQCQLLLSILLVGPINKVFKG